MPTKKTNHRAEAGGMSSPIPSSESPTNGSPLKPATLMMI